jgi:hypothetical protein
MGRRARERVAAQFRIERMTEGMIGLFEAARVARDRAKPAPLSDALAHAWAVQAVEGLRVEAELEGARAAAHASAGAAHLAEMRLHRIEGSSSWRLVRAAKRTAVYRLFARLRHGRDWQRNAP